MSYAVITAAEAKAIEQAACTQMNLPLLSLMQSAGEAAARLVQQIYPLGKVIVLCGPGGNGGDGYVAARLLLAEGRSVSVISSRPLETLSGDAAIMAHAWTACGGMTRIFGDEPLGHLSESDVIIDALLGIGTTSKPDGAIGALCAWANDSPAKVVSLDIATGVNSDTADVYDGAIHADVTISFIAPKRGNILYPGATHTGKLCIAPLALPVIDTDLLVDVPFLQTLADIRTVLPTRVQHRNANKGSHGRVLVIAGSDDMPGAALLTLRASMHAGAGYATLISTKSVCQLAAATLPEAIYVACPSEPNGTLSFTSTQQEILKRIPRTDCIAIGPGLGRTDETAAIVAYVLETFTGPVVIDADALYAASPTHLKERSAAVRETILTPHPGEAASTYGVESRDRDRLAAVRELTFLTHATVLLKGTRTLVASSGEHTDIIRKGTPALGTAGSGDTLTGIIAALAAQGLPPHRAAVAGATIHARAGELAAAKNGLMNTSASDICDCIGAAWMRIAAGEDTSPWVD
jgi:NAD(P)H-hydrate epimerase